VILSTKEDRGRPKIKKLKKTPSGGIWRSVLKKKASGTGRRGRGGFFCSPKKIRRKKTQKKERKTQEDHGKKSGSGEGKFPTWQ